MVCMNTNQTQRLPHAAREPLPELAAFLEPFHACFARSEGRHRLERYITGLLSEHPNKNCDTLAQVIPGSSEQSFQGLLTTMVWDAEAVNSIRVQRLRRLPTEGDGVLVLDDTGFPKKGHASAGVARQYTGTTGTVTNCQVAVTCVYAERTLSWPIAARLYLPQSWADDAERRARAHVPEDVQFQTKPEIALALIDQARDMGVPYTCITVNGGYGDVPSFLDGLEVRDEGYVAAIHRDFGVAPHADGRDAQRVDRWVATQPNHHWRTLSWRDGSNGPLKAHFLARRAWRKDDLGDWRAGWVLAERPAHRPEIPLLLEQSASRDAADPTGGLCPSAAPHRTVPRGVQGQPGLGSVSRAALGRVSPAYAAGADRLQLPGVAGVAPTAAGSRAGPPTGRFFPHDGIGGRCRWRASSAGSLTGCGCWHWKRHAGWAICSSFVRNCVEYDAYSYIYLTCDNIVSKQ